MEEQDRTEKAEDVRDNNSDSTRTVPDGGWGWFVSAAAFLVQFIILGFQNNLGLFHGAHLEHFKKSKLETGWVSSLALGNMFLFAPMTSALCEKYGCRRVGFIGGLLTVVGMLASSFAVEIYPLYFTFGVVYGVGTSMCYFPTLRMLPYWFSRHLALANGIAAAGSGVGTVALGPLLEMVMSTMGWKNAARIFSCFLLIPTLAALVYRVPPSNPCHRGNERPKTKILDLGVLKNRAFIFLCLGMSTFQLGYPVPLIHLPHYAQQSNVSKKNSSFLIGIMAIVSSFSRLFFGKLSDHPRVKRFYLYQMSFLFIGIADTLVPQITNFTGFVIYMVSFGIFDGCFTVLIAIVVGDVVGIDNISSGMAVKFFFMAMTIFIGPPIAGWLVDISGSYNLAFYAAGAVSFVGFGFLSLVPVLIPEDVGSRNCLAREAAHMEEIPDKQDAPCGTNDLSRTDQVSKETQSDASTAGNLFSSSTKINTCLGADIDVAVGAYSNKVMDDVESTRL